MVKRKKYIVAWTLVLGILVFSGCAREQELDNLSDLNTAIYRDDLGTIKTIVAEDPKVINATQYPADRTPLHNAAYNGADYVVAFLIKAGADVNATDDKGLTPLHYAANYGRPENAKLLLDNGANINAVDGRGRTPLHGVGRGKWFATLGAGRFPADQEAVAKLLLAHGARTDVKDQYGKTPLDYALENHETAIAQLLEAASK